MLYRPLVCCRLLLLLLHLHQLLVFLNLLMMYHVPVVSMNLCGHAHDFYRMSCCDGCRCDLDVSCSILCGVLIEMVIDDLACGSWMHVSLT